MHVNPDSFLKTRHTLFRKFKSEQEERLLAAFPGIFRMQLLVLSGVLVFDRCAIGTVYSLSITGILVLLALCDLLLRNFFHDLLSRHVSPIHAGRVFVWNCAVSAVNYLTFYVPEPDLHWQAAAVVFYMFVLGVSFLTAYSLRRFIFLLLLPPLGGLLLFPLLQGGLSTSSALLILFPFITWIMWSIAAGVANGLYYREFRMRYLAERRGEKISEDLSREKSLNTRLEKTTERLKQEIEERKEVEKTLEQFAAFDELTSVYNRRAGLEVLKEGLHYAERKQQSLTIAFVDLDRLKIVNDNFGHRAGDGYLRDVVALMKRHLRKSDAISRYGGDEFLVILSDCSETEARQIFSRVEEDMGLMNEGERLFPLSFSYGIAESSPGRSEGYAELISRADERMYMHKQNKHREDFR